MKLFTLKDSHNGKAIAESFSSKKEAKQARDKLNGGTPAELVEAEKHLQYTVSRGADHRHA